MRVFRSGRDGVEALTKSPHRAPVSAVVFVPNEHILLSIDQRDTLYAYSLVRQEQAGSLVLTEHVTCMGVPFNSKLAHLGTVNGRVVMVDVLSCTISTESIPPAPAASLSSSVTALSFFEDETLIGYDSGLIALWDGKKRQFLCQFQGKSVRQCGLCHFSNDLCSLSRACRDMRAGRSSSLATPTA